ncbi:hypothetical protein JCM17380_44450 [Desulfosporosinus burensis]
MSKTMKQTLLRGCLAVIVALSSTLTPVVANAATTNISSSVTRIGGTDQYETAALLAQTGWSGTSDNVVLSAGMNYSLVDALAAGPLAAKLKAPILLTDGGQSLSSFAKAELLRLKPKKVYITSGTAVIKSSAIDEIRAMGITPVQLGGYDQYETSVNIAKELVNQGVNISRVILAAGWLSPADALSVAPIAAAQEIPILTTTQDQLPNSVKTYLESIKAKVTDSYVVGGSAVVAEAVKSQLPGKVSRYSGQTKYDTNVEILKNFAREYKNDKVYVANGETLVDALAGVPLAAANWAPVVLVNQQVEKTTKDFVKLTISTAKMVAIGGEAVVPSAGIDALTSGVTYASDNDTIGSTDITKPVELTENVQILGNNITLKNALANYSVYVKGDNVTLSNLTVKGTVFLDPGDNGSATLDGVSATNIVILSGAKNSIHLKNTTANDLTVDSSSSNVRVELTGTTTIGNTVVRSYAIIHSNGAMGQMVITNKTGESPVVELSGTFSEPVIVEGQSTVRAASGASLALQISPKSKEQTVTLEGIFTTVEVNKEGQVQLGASAVITDLITNTKAILNVNKGAKVTHFDNRGNTVDISGDGASAVPKSSTISTEEPIVTPPVQSPIGGAGNPPSSLPTSVTLSNLKVITDPADLLGTYNNGATINLSGLDDDIEVLGFALTADQSCTFQFKVDNKTQNIALIAGQERVVTVGDLILGESMEGGVSLSTFRLFYTTKTLQGSLLKDGVSVGTLKVTLKFK